MLIRLWIQGSQPMAGTAPTGGSAAAQHLRDLAWLRRVRDRIDRDDAQPLNVEALARGAPLSAGHRSRQFRRTDGESPHACRCPTGCWSP